MAFSPEDWRFRNAPAQAPFDCGRGRNPGASGVSGSEAEPSLGNRREYFHPEGGEAKPSKREKLNKIRRETLADARQAARIFRSKEAEFEQEGGDVSTLAGRGVCLCGWHQIRDHNSKVMRVRRDEYWHAYTTGTQMCGLRHVCPVCTAKSAEEDRRFVNDGLAAARALPGVWPVMLTLTTRHSRKERAEDVLAGVRTAEQRVKRLKVWQRISEQSIGYVRAFEWTHGKNGHHPHYHGILLIKAETEAEAIELVEQLRPAYMRQLARAGRDGTSAAAWRHSFQVQGAGAVRDYITKWGQAEEITQGHKKDGRGEGLTPWQLLRRSRTFDDNKERQQAAAIWWEIVQATKGVSQLYKSAGFIELVEAWRELEPEGEEAPEPEELADLGVRKGRLASSRFEAYRIRTLAVREAAERHDDLLTAREAVERELAVGYYDDDALDEIDTPDEIDLIDEDDDGSSGSAHMSPAGQAFRNSSVLLKPPPETEFSIRHCEQSEIVADVTKME